MVYKVGTTPKRIYVIRNYKIPLCGIELHYYCLTPGGWEMSLLAMKLDV